jgi:CHAT domain-containing protein
MCFAMSIAAAFVWPCDAYALAQASANEVGAASAQLSSPATLDSGSAERSEALARADEIAVIALDMVERGDMAGALPLYAEELALRRQALGERHPVSIAVLADYAFVMDSLGRVQEAEPLYADALRLRQDVLGERHPDTIVSLGDYAFILQVLGRSAEALPLFADAAQISAEVLGEGHPSALIARANYGRALFSLGRTDEAQASLSDTLRTMREELGEEHPHTLSTLAFYASALQSLNRASEAEPLFAAVLRQRREILGEQHPDTIGALNNYAGVLLNLQRPADAEPFMAESLRLSREVLGERHPTTLYALNNYGFVLEQLNRRAEAIPIYQEVVEFQREVLGDTHPLTLVGLNNYAVTLSHLGRIQESLPLYEESVRIHREMFGDRHPQTIRVVSNYTQSLLINSQSSEALTQARQVAMTLRRRATDLARQGGVRGSAQQSRELSDRQSIEKLFVDTLLANRDLPGVNQNQIFAEAFVSFQLASATSTSQAVREAAAARFASGLGLQELVQERQRLSRNWATIEEGLVAAQAGADGSGSRRQSMRESLVAIEDRVEVIDEKLLDEAPQYFDILRQRAVPLANMVDVLGEDEAVLFLVPTPFGTHSFAISNQELKWSRAVVDENSIGNVIADFRAGLEIAGDAEYLPLFDLEQAHNLYRDLVAPVESVLEGKSRVYVVADGALSRLPLGTLITSPPVGENFTDDPDVLRNADWLADRYALVQLPSLQSLVFIRSYGIEGEAQEETSFAGFGAPVLEGAATLRGARSATLAPVDAARLTGSLRGASGLSLMNPDALRTLAALPGTRGELERVREALGAPANALYLGAEMTESAIREANLSGVSILHLATHGFTSEESGDAAEPGLVFTPPGEARADDDGYLAASEVVALNLASARWVILSACNTASPSGAPGETGLSGLAQAFFYAGAESLLVSHWPVFDTIAPALTVEALKRSQAGEPRAEALQAAMQAIRNDPALDAAHPAVWAPFTLVGEGR